MFPRSWQAKLSPLLRDLGIGSLHVVNFACAVHLFKEYVGSPCWMEGPSMLPTLAAGGQVVIERMVPHRLLSDRISRGDLVTFRSPINSSRIVCKRLIGLPGDVICVDPSGLKAPSTEHVVIPKGHVWLAGDNAAVSTDSRDYGPVSMALIRGRITAIISPRSDFKVFKRGTGIEFIDA